MADVGFRGEAEALEILNNLGAAVAAERDLERALQLITDAAVKLTGAEFGAFSYHVINGAGGSFTLYTISGVPREEFPQLPMPGNTDVFAPTFSGEAVLRSEDMTRDPRFRRNDAYHGMAESHLAVRSYLAAPVVSRSGEVLGGLFMGHSQTRRFAQRTEPLLIGIAAQAAIAIDKAHLVQAAQAEIAKRQHVEDELRALNESLERRIAERTRELAAANELLRSAIISRERFETGSRAMSEQFRLLVQSVVDYAIYMIGIDGRVTTWNAGAQRIKGYSADEIIGAHFSTFYTPEAREASEPEQALTKARDFGRVEMQGWRVRKDGSRFWASVIIDAVRDDEGRLIGFAKVTRDETERRDAEYALEQTREALFQAQKMESIGQLTGGIAHDFNNMLAGIVGAMHLLERRVAAQRYDDLGKYVEAALDSANRAAALTSRLLAFGRRASLDMKPIDVAEAIHGVELILRRSVGENVEIRTNIERDDLCAVTDANQLQSALLNLVINARDAMPDGGDVIISASSIEVADAALPGSELAAGKYVLITVADNGVGMDVEVLARAFDPFFTTKPIGAGTGLGLSMVYGFLKQAKGFARIESTPGEGTIVFMYLPAGDEPCVETGMSEQKVEAGKGETVLVVEDEHLVRLLVTDVLHELGYTALEAKDAQTALPILQSHQRLDLLISDVGLPGMNGRQLADVAREHRPDLRVLFLTGYAEHAAVRSGFLTPGMDLMTKPFSIDELSQKIRDMIGKSSVSPR